MYTSKDQMTPEIIDDVESPQPIDPNTLALARRYWHLSRNPLTDGNAREEQELEALLDLVLYDNELEHWVTLMDELLYPNPDASYSLPTFIDQLQQENQPWPPDSNLDGMRLTIFQDRVEALITETRLLEVLDCFTVVYGSEEYKERQNYLSFPPYRIYPIVWQPGDESNSHHHDGDLSIIYVQSGVISHGVAPQGECLQWQEHSPGSFIHIPAYYVHQLANRSSAVTKTLHFKTGYHGDQPLEAPSPFSNTASDQDLGCVHTC